MRQATKNASVDGVLLLLMFMFLPPARSTRAADTLAGAYRDDRVTVVLERDPAAADAYRGSIKTGGQTYPLTARLRDGTLAGTFTDPDQDSFEFSATLDGATLNFKTGKATYHLAAVQDQADRPNGDVGNTAPLAPPHIASLPWLHEGMQLTFTWKTDHKDNIGQNDAGAAGWSQITVTCIEGDKVALFQKGFADARPSINEAPVPLAGFSSMLVSLNDPGDYWMEPKKLAALRSIPEPDGRGLAVTGLKWKSGEREVDAIRVNLIKGDNYISHVFDRQTGICLHYETRLPSAGDAEITITSGDFVSFRDLNIPWAGEAVPQWAATLKALHYRGALTFPGSPVQVPNEVFDDLKMIDQGAGWVRLASSDGVRYPNGPNLPAMQAQFVFGHSQFGAFWVDPAVLAKLRQGQVLDEDPVTRMKTAVTRITDDSVRIESISGGGEIGTEYDRRSGLATASSSYSALTKQLWAVKLQSRE